MELEHHLGNFPQLAYGHVLWDRLQCELVKQHTATRCDQDVPSRQVGKGNAVLSQQRQLLDQIMQYQRPLAVTGIFLQGLYCCLPGEQREPAVGHSFVNVQEGEALHVLDAKISQKLEKAPLHRGDAVNSYKRIVVDTVEGEHAV
uniref:Uncharacterized protein n=1 Tax=Spironucleus salmonicida TaxID=348837 RepID=V6LRZ8_9EUKA|eukprot:EST47350.1 Hypothetical protein SS50377_12558 [Spironucleus salmonicida]